MFRKILVYINLLLQGTIHIGYRMSFSKILYLTGIDFGIQWILWGAAALLQTEKFYDLAGKQTKTCIYRLRV